MRYVEVIHSPIWDIRIVVFTPIYFCVGLVCPQFVEEQLILSVIIKSFWQFQVIGVLFASRYKTTSKIDRESDVKIKFLIVGTIDAWFRVSLCFDAVSTLIFSGFFPAWYASWKYILHVYSCCDGCAPCGVVVCLSAIFP